jgi:hypothetical protein
MIASKTHHPLGVVNRITDQVAETIYVMDDDRWPEVNTGPNTVEPRCVLVIRHSHQAVGRQQRIFRRLEKCYGGTIAGVQHDPPIGVNRSERGTQMCIEGAFNGNLIGD